MSDKKGVIAKSGFIQFGHNRRMEAIKLDSSDWVITFFRFTKEEMSEAQEDDFDTCVRMMGGTRITKTIRISENGALQLAAGIIQYESLFGKTTE